MVRASLEPCQEGPVNTTVVGLRSPSISAATSRGWQAQALCAQADPDAWFPEKGGQPGKIKAICRQCPVRPECLNAALERDEMFGIWGGLSRQERVAVKRRRRTAEDAA